MTKRLKAVRLHNETEIWIQLEHITLVRPNTQGGVSVFFLGDLRTPTDLAHPPAEFIEMLERRLEPF